MQQVLSTDNQMISFSSHPLFRKILELIDKLLRQIRTIQTLFIRTYGMIEQLPSNLHSLFIECFTVIHNASRVQYCSRLSEAELIHIPQIKLQLKQAITLEQQLNIINMTDKIVEDITLNIIKPSLSFLTETLDCFKNKSQINQI